MPFAQSQDVFAGLQPLVASAFPRRCGTCGREYADTVDFIASTSPPFRSHTGLKQGYDDAERPIVELFRNCSCGSTLMERFRDRRDNSESGYGRRRHFEALPTSLRFRTRAHEVADMGRHALLGDTDLSDKRG